MSRQSEVDKIMKYIPSLSGRINTRGIAEAMVDHGIRSKDGFEIEFIDTRKLGSPTFSPILAIIKSIDYKD